MSDMPESVTYCFDDFADMFVELRAFGTPSELHGLMCGQLAAGVRLDADAWLTMLSPILMCKKLKMMMTRLN